MKNIILKISATKFALLVRCFAYDVTATSAASIIGINRNTVNKWYNEFRSAIYNSQKSKNIVFSKTICEIDESYFGGKRIRGKPGRGSYGKVIVFGIIERGGTVFTQMVPNCQKRTLIPIIKRHIHTSCVINSDMWSAYRCLSKLGYKHKTINHSSGVFALEDVHTNSIENFWGFAKMRLSKFHGMHKESFHLHLKECEFRFNNRNLDVYKEVKKIVASHLSLS